MHQVSRQSRAGLAVLAALVLLLAACSGGAEPEEEAAGTQDGGAFPVTIEHKYGSTAVDSRPQRVVTVGLTDQDALLALGVVPVATTKWLGDYPGAVGPWAEDALGDADTPVALDDVSGIRFEKIAELQPDLIIGLYSGMTEQDYRTLSKIAPTIAQPGDHPDFGIPWQDLTKTVGKAVGKSEEARRLVENVDRRFAEARQAHPEFGGATGVVATTYEGYFVYGTADPRSRVLTGLGFELPNGLDDAIGDEFGANISRERVDLLDTDAIVWITGDDGKQLRGDAVYTNLPVAKEKREVLIDENGDHGNAFSFVSVLSLPYLLDWLTPRLSAAADGDPATTA